MYGTLQGTVQSKQPPYMLEIGLDQSSIAATVLANIALYLAIHIQKYAKKKIIHFALHGLSTLSLQRLWFAGMALLLIAECSYFVAFGINSDMELSSLGVFTAISNTTLPPLFFSCKSCTIFGSVLTQLGVLLLIFVPPTEKALSFKPFFDLKIPETLICILCEIVLGLVLLCIRTWKPVNCSLKLFANCGLSALMGSHTVTAIKILTLEEDSDDLPLLAAFIIISFLLEIILVAESLHKFPIWQVVPHHFALFVTFIFINNSILLHQLDNFNNVRMCMAMLAYAILIVGIWVAAKPQLDIPVNITETGLFPEMRRRVLENWQSKAMAAPHENSPPILGTEHLDTQYGHACLRDEYCQLIHSNLPISEASEIETP